MCVCVCGGACGVMVIVLENRHEFESWARLFAFAIALIYLRKECIQLSSFQQYVNNRADWLFNHNMAIGQGEGKTLNSNLLNSAKKIYLVLHPTWSEVR